MKPRVYLAGPLSNGEANSHDARLDAVREAIAWGQRLIKAGFAPLVPHLTYYIDPKHQFAAYEDWIAIDLAWVQVADAVLRMPGASKGADAEVEYAINLGIPVRYDVESLRDIEPRSQKLWPARGDRRFFDVLNEMAKMHAKKGTDYGREADCLANIRSSEAFGIPAWLGAMLRGSDKVHRIQSYALNGELANEGVEDSLLDLACYAVIALVLFRERGEASGGTADAGGVRIPA